jgi:hypothetical protein
MVYHALKATIRMLAQGYWYGGNERISEGPREETSKEFRIFSEAWEVHTWPEAWIGFNDLRKTRIQEGSARRVSEIRTPICQTVTGQPFS